MAGPDFVASGNLGPLRINANSQGDSYVINGNVGIGTASPAVRLHVQAPAGVEMARFVAADSGDAFIQAWAGTSQAYLFANRNSYGGVGSLSSNAFSIRTGNTDRVYIEAAGRVSVGTTAPGAKLDVAGDILVSAVSPENPLHTGLQRVGADTILWYGGGTGNLQLKAGQGGQPGDHVTITPAGDLLLKGAVAKIHDRPLVGRAANANNDLLANVGPSGNPKCQRRGVRAESIREGQIQRWPPGVEERWARARLCRPRLGVCASPSSTRQRGRGLVRDRRAR